MHSKLIKCGDLLIWLVLKYLLTDIQHLFKCVQP